MSTQEQTMTAADLPATLCSLYRAYQKTSIYPPGHPAIPDALAEVTAGLSAALAAQDRLVVGVTREQLVVGDEPVADSSGAVKALAALLHDLDLTAIEFHAGIEAQQLERFILEVARARRERMRASELVEELNDDPLTNVVLHPVDYAALSFSDGARQTESIAEHELWQNLSKDLSTATDDGRSPEELAQAINRHIDDNEGAGVGLLRKRIENVSRDLNSTQPGMRAASRKRMKKFVSALSSRLRVDLLRVDPELPAGGLDTVTELMDVMPETDLLEALQRIDREGARVPGQMLTLMNKLARLSRTRPTLASGLEDTLTKWGMRKELLSAEPGEFSEALEEVFQRRCKTDYNPAAYQGLLDNLSRQVVPGRGEHRVSGYRDPTDREDVRLHVAQIACRLLAKSGGEQYRSSLLAQVELGTDLLLQHGEFETTLDAAVAARAYNLHRGELDSTRDAARQYLAGFVSKHRIQLLLEHGFSGESVSEAALSLLNLGGVTALGHAFNKMTEELPEEVRLSLQGYAAARGTEELARVIKWRYERGWEALHPMFPILRRLDPADALPLTRQLVDHEDVAVRAEALRLLFDLEKDTSYLERFLRAGLSDESPDYVAVAIELLDRLGGSAALDALADYLDGNVPAVLPTSDFATRSISALLRHGDEGEDRLCRILDTLRTQWNSQRIEIGRLVRAALTPHRSRTRIDDCLKRWRWSPGGLLGAVMPRREPT